MNKNKTNSDLKTNLDSFIVSLCDINSYNYNINPEIVFSDKEQFINLFLAVNDLNPEDCTVDITESDSPLTHMTITRNALDNRDREIKTHSITLYRKEFIYRTCFYSPIKIRLVEK